MESMLGTIATTVATVISGVILFWIKRALNTQQKSELRREGAKAKENELILRSLNALGKLTVANSVSLRDGHTSADMTSALKEYESVERELYSYLISAYTDSVA